MTLGAEDAGLLPVRDLATRRIYGYQLDIPGHEGQIKVGETERAVKARVAEQVNTAGLIRRTKIVFDEPAVTDDGHTFGDKAVHDILTNIPGVERVDTGGGSEWFRCSLDQLKNAYAVVVAGKPLAVERTQRFGLRDEQRRAIAQTTDYFESEWASDSGSVPRFLWNAKMRFGKTFTAYHLAEKLKSKRVLVVTFKPAVADAWKSDLVDHVDFEGWEYRSGDLPEADDLLSLPERLVYFNSFQAIFGRDPVTHEFKAKHQWIAEMEWDLVIFDEFHYGAWRYADRELIAGEVGGGEAEHNADYSEEINMFEEIHDEWGRSELEFLPFKGARAFLYLSGTPFRALASGQFQSAQIFNWTYTDEQSAKAKWGVEHADSKNPYAGLPEMHLLTYVLPPALRKFASTGNRDEFDLNEFFAAMGRAKSASFVHKDEVQAWLTWMRGQDFEASLSTSGTGKPFPYADTSVLRYMNHTVWYLPSVAAVQAMQNLIAEPQNVRPWGEYEVIAVAGNAAGVGVDALPPVRHAIGSGYDTKTITLTCGKLLTGVTVPQWSAILMLCNLSSPETYFQAAFRVQSAWILTNPDGNDPSLERVEKPACLVIDFAPNRALKLYADYGLRLGKGDDPESDLEELVRFLPVLAFEGATMTSVQPSDVLDTALQSAGIDARRMESAKYINPRITVARKLDPSVQLALGRIGRSRGSTGADSTEVVVSATPELRSVDTEPRHGESEDDAPASDSPDEEIRDLAARLQFLAKRINAFMYLSSGYEKTLRDVLSTAEIDLFEEAMELRPEHMQALVSAGLFNEGALRLAIFEFARAERLSFDAYLSPDPWSEDGMNGGDSA